MMALISFISRLHAQRFSRRAGLVAGLRIGQHAELRHVQAFELDLLARPASAGSALTTLKTTNVQAEGVDGAERRAAELQQELRRVAVEQPGDALPGLAQIRGRADAVPAGAVGAVREDADARRRRTSRRSRAPKSRRTDRRPSARAR